MCCACSPRITPGLQYCAGHTTLLKQSTFFQDVTATMLALGEAYEGIGKQLSGQEELTAQLGREIMHMCVEVGSGS